MSRPNKRIKKPKVADLLAQAQAALAAQQAMPEEERLDEAAVKRLMQLSRSEINVLNMISSGNPPRNALAILAAIRLKLEHTVTPVQAGTGAVPISVTINTLGPETHPAVAAPPPLEPQDLTEDQEEIH